MGLPYLYERPGLMYSSDLSYKVLGSRRPCEQFSFQRRSRRSYALPMINALLFQSDKILPLPIYD